MLYIKKNLTFTGQFSILLARLTGQKQLHYYEYSLYVKMTIKDCQRHVHLLFDASGTPATFSFLQNPKLNISNFEKYNFIKVTP